MNTKIILLLLLIVLVPLSSLRPYDDDIDSIVNLEIEPESTFILPEETILKIPKPHALNKLGIGGHYFVFKMGILESANSYTIVNRFGYMGKYQFNKKTLRLLGFNNRQIKTFLYNPNIQELAMEKLTIHNKLYFDRNNLLGYVGTTVGGVRISLEGMLAAAHLRGPSSVKKYLQTNGVINRVDGNNTSVKNYLKEFERIAI